jgi:hypothetical protein
VLSAGLGALKEKVDVEALPIPDAAKEAIQGAIPSSVPEVPEVPHQATEAIEKGHSFVEHAIHQGKDALHDAVPAEVLSNPLSAIRDKLNEQSDTSLVHNIEEQATGAVESAQIAAEPLKSKLKSAAAQASHEAPHVQEAAAEFIHNKLPGQVEQLKKKANIHVKSPANPKAVMGKFKSIQNKLSHPGQKEVSGASDDSKTGGFYRSEIIPSKEVKEIIAGASNFESEEDKAKVTEHLASARLVKHYEKVVAGVIHLYILKLEEDKFECYEVFTGFSGASEILHFIKGENFHAVTYRCLRLPQGETVEEELAAMFS